MTSSRGLSRDHQSPRVTNKIREMAVWGGIGRTAAQPRLLSTPLLWRRRSRFKPRPHASDVLERKKRTFYPAIRVAVAKSLSYRIRMYGLGVVQKYQKYDGEFSLLGGLGKSERRRRRKRDGSFADLRGMQKRDAVCRDRVRTLARTRAAAAARHRDLRPESSQGSVEA
ncbi:hypothetical protein CSUB01_00676 [Colletotrichum sublineola]|uniref:Uncharacterized protein n=1 Tax=Colletotrichum sublineola TaxID=1173701 RepID=A0A066XIZ3_COLSU|nr:hypothetical protein CSUB01_00676 [Colletotrichum sublineola]